MTVTHEVTERAACSRRHPMTDGRVSMTGYDGLMTYRRRSNSSGINRMSAFMTDMTDFSPFSYLLLFSIPLSTSCVSSSTRAYARKQGKIRHIRHWSTDLAANTTVRRMTDSAQSVITRHQPVMGGELWTSKLFWTA
jgi:hypothetical protein